MVKTLISSLDIAFGNSTVYGMMTATGEVPERAIIADFAPKSAIEVSQGLRRTWEEDGERREE